MNPFIQYIIFCKNRGFNNREFDLEDGLCASFKQKLTTAFCVDITINKLDWVVVSWLAIRKNWQKCSLFNKSSWRKLSRTCLERLWGKRVVIKIVQKICNPVFRIILKWMLLNSAVSFKKSHVESRQSNLRTVRLKNSWFRHVESRQSKAVSGGQEEMSRYGNRTILSF